MLFLIYVLFTHMYEQYVRVWRRMNQKQSYLTKAFYVTSSSTFYLPSPPTLYFNIQPPCRQIKFLCKFVDISNYITHHLNFLYKYFFMSSYVHTDFNKKKTENIEPHMQIMLGLTTTTTQKQHTYTHVKYTFINGILVERLNFFVFVCSKSFLWLWGWISISFDCFRFSKCCFSKKA